MVGSSLLIGSREEPKGILKHMVLTVQGEELSKKSLKELKWGLLSRMEASNQHEVGPGNPQIFPMNIILWNCRGALNPRFHVTLKNLIHTHYPSIVIITET